MCVKMSSHEFQNIVRYLQDIRDTVVIAATKEAVRFGEAGDFVNGQIILGHSASVRALETKCPKLFL